MRVLIADKLLPSAAERLRALGLEVLENAALKTATLGDALGEHGSHVLVVRSTKVPAEVLSRGRLGLIVRAGAGVNTIDVAAASERGVYVANCPGKNSLAVSELTIGLLVALDRRIPDAVADLRAGLWRKGEYSKARGLAGRRMGVVGAGRIGMAVARQARGLGMRVTVWNHGGRRKEAVEAEGFAFEPDLLELAANSDAVSLHLASTPETRGLAGEAFFGALPEGAYFLNTSRADLVDEAALRRAMSVGGVRAAVDVFTGEGAGAADSIDVDLLAEPNLIATPHIGASTLQAQEAVADEVVRIVAGYARSGSAPSVVNVEAASPATHVLIVRHLNRVGVLSHVFAALKDAQINALETENIVFGGGKACIARIAIDSAPAASILDSVPRGNPDILDLHLVARS
ncbi:MAG: hydroxyacid dehydrogenase [Deltaproteobacteria bacterium]|nr:hydroxyacid dehydrogenase [Deltaproteobacteria bacterium]